MKIDECFKILGVGTNASIGEVKQAYRDKAQIFHPDRFVKKPRIQKQVEDKFKEINNAYEILKDHLSVTEKGNYGDIDRPESDQVFIYADCPNCGTKNRISEIPGGRRPICDECGSVIYFNKNRILCSNRNCRGVIGTDGRCRECGKSKITAHDDTCISYAYGVIYDKNTGLEWVAGPDKDTNWYEAKRWANNLNIAGGGWRMPTIAELRTLYKEGIGSRNMTTLLKTTGWWVWSGEAEGMSSAWYFFFSEGGKLWGGRGRSSYTRGFAVRSRR